MAPLGDIKLRVKSVSNETSGPIIHSSTTLPYPLTFERITDFLITHFSISTSGPIIASDPIIQSFNFALSCIRAFPRILAPLCAAVPFFPNDLKLASRYDSGSLSQ